MLCYHSALADIEMIAYGTEASCLVVFEHLLCGIVSVAACCRAVNNDISYAVAAVQQQTVLHVFGKLSFATHLFAGDNQWKSFCYHVCQNKVHEDTVIALKIVVISVHMALIITRQLSRCNVIVIRVY